MKVYNLIIFLGCFSMAHCACPSPFTPFQDQCIYVEDKIQRGFNDAREYCRLLGGEGSQADLITAPTCDEFTLLARYMEFNDQLALQGSSYYVGVQRAFSVGWSWITFEPIPLGPPFWAYDKGDMDTMYCASINHATNYQLSCSVCDTKRNFICGMPNPAVEKVSKVEEKQVSVPSNRSTKCPDHGVQIGHHCYCFHDNKETWHNAEKYCTQDVDDPHVINGFLFYPESCDEYTLVARHLSIEEYKGCFWVGAVDTSGNNAWFWTDGSVVPIGVPFWAHDEPSHSDHDQVHEHCGLMSGDKKGYLKDAHCDDLHGFICKYTVY